MELTKLELQVLRELALGNENIIEIAKALARSKSQVYRAIKNLEKKDFIEKKARSEISSKRQVHISLLLNLLKESTSIIDFLADSGIKILESLQTPKNVSQIVNETKLKKATIYKKLKKALNISLIKKNKKEFEINSAIWPGIKDFIIELLKYEQTIDSRVPADSTIYFKNDKEILYSTRYKQNAAKTAFSAYEDYGIKILSNEDFYYLPKKKLSVQDVFKHSIIITEKKKSYRLIIYCALFYSKFKKQLQGINFRLLKTIKMILEDKNVKDYPSYLEIKEKAEQNDIKI